MKRSGKIEMLKGIATFLWEELKTINFAKLSSLYNILVGYLRMKFTHSRKLKGQSSDFESPPSHLH